MPKDDPKVIINKKQQARRKQKLSIVSQEGRFSAIDRQMVMWGMKNGPRFITGVLEDRKKKPNYRGPKKLKKTTAGSYPALNSLGEKRKSEEETLRQCR